MKRTKKKVAKKKVAKKKTPGKKKIPQGKSEPARLKVRDEILKENDRQTKKAEEAVRIIRGTGQLQNVHRDIVPIEKLDNHPRRFQDLSQRIEQYGFPDVFSKMDKETLLKALELAAKYQPLLTDDINLQIEKVSALTAFHSTPDPKKGLRNAGKKLRLVTNKKGKRTFWTPPRKETLVNTYEKLLKSGQSPKDAITKILEKNESLFSSANQIARRLRACGLKNIPDLSTRSSPKNK